MVQNKPLTLLYREVPSNFNIFEKICSIVHKQYDVLPLLGSKASEDCDDDNDGD